MKLKNIKSLRKPLLLLGASLCGLLILQAAHAMVKALDIDLTTPENPALLERTTETAEDALQIPSSVMPEATNPSQPPTGDRSAEPQSAQESQSQPSSAAQSPAATTSERQLLAINTGETNPQQPVSQVSPSEIAASEWYGASFPVEDFQAYTSPFGYRSSPEGGYSTEFHYGLDMAAPEGSYIRNWWSGKVVEVSDDSNCGTSVVVESGAWMHIYCHMRGHVEEDSKGRYMIDREGGIQIWEGQDLPAGARIGRVGMSGRTTGPHLHWGLKFNENWVDPALVLRAMYVGQQAVTRSVEESSQN
jgi:murein DD-endopeptidase MepM/ murein hydrolase activator NlpD